MNTAKESSDDFFIGDFTESEKVIAAKHILEKQNAARWAYVISTVISVVIFEMCPKLRHNMTAQPLNC